MLIAPEHVRVECVGVQGECTTAHMDGCARLRCTGTVRRSLRLRPVSSPHVRTPRKRRWMCGARSAHSCNYRQGWCGPWAQRLQPRGSQCHVSVTESQDRMACVQRHIAATGTAGGTPPCRRSVATTTPCKKNRVELATRRRSHCLMRPPGCTITAYWIAHVVLHASLAARCSIDRGGSCSVAHALFPPVPADP
jgi:hypothetical protein